MKSIGNKDKLPVLTLMSELEFGKYKGYKLRTVIDLYKPYAEWLLLESGTCNCDEETRDYLDGIIQANGYEDRTEDIASTEWI